MTNSTITITQNTVTAKEQTFNIWKVAPAAIASKMAKAFLWQPKKLSRKTDHEDDLDSQILTMQLLYHRLDINTRMKQAQHRTGEGRQ
jgi:hypothetical protein